MRLTFLGATHEVTGSCYYLEAAGKKFLVDCGMEQGPNIYENKPIPVPASQRFCIDHARASITPEICRCCMRTASAAQSI